jgi:hypothetical protein
VLVSRVQRKDLKLSKMKICKSFHQHLLPRQGSSCLLNSICSRYLSKNISINRDAIIKCVGLYCDDVPDLFRVEISTHWEQFVDIKRLSNRAQSVDVQYNYMDANMELLPLVDESHPINAVNLIVGSDSATVNDEAVDLQLVVPEYVDIFILGKKLDLTIHHKVAVSNFCILFFCRLLF